MLTKGPIPEGPLASQKPNFHVIYIGKLWSAPPLCYFLQPIIYSQSALRCSSQRGREGGIPVQKGEGAEALYP